MALFNETLAGRFNELIRRLHQMKSTPAPQVSPEISHAIILENDRPESHLLAGSVLWSGSINANGVAAALGIIKVENPVASGILSVVQRIYVTGEAAPQLSVLQIDAPGLTGTGAVAQTATGAIVRDSRRGINKVATTILRSYTATAYTLLGKVAQVQLPAAAAASYWLPVDVVLAPGTALVVVAGTPNTYLPMGFQGYERAVHPEELQNL
jgi:hypothetical protein